METDNGLKAGLRLSLRPNSLYVNRAQKTGVSARHGSSSASDMCRLLLFFCPFIKLLLSHSPPEAAHSLTLSQKPLSHQHRHMPGRLKQ